MKKIPLQTPKDFPVAARDRASLEEYFGKDNVSTLKKRNPENVLVVVDKSNKKQVWVRPSSDKQKKYGDYKKAYEDVHNLKVPSDEQVDHIQSQARGGQQGYKYVRLEKINKKVNHAWGIWFERVMALVGKKGYLSPRGPVKIRQIDIWQWWKINGLMPQDVVPEVFEGKKNKHYQGTGQFVSRNPLGQ